MELITEYYAQILEIIGKITVAIVAITAFIKSLQSEKRAITTVNTVVDGVKNEMAALDNKVTVTRAGIVQGFKDAVITKDLKVSINSQVKKILDENKTEMLDIVTKSEERRTNMVYWALKILRYTAAFDKLTVEQQSELEETMALIAEDEKIVDTII